MRFEYVAPSMYLKIFQHMIWQSLVKRIKIMTSEFVSESVIESILNVKLYFIYILFQIYIFLKSILQNMSGQPIDTNCMTLTRFVLAEQRKYPTAAGNLSQLLTSIQSAVKAISAAVRRAGIANLGGAVGDVNVQGEDVQKLDVLSNELFINMLRFVWFFSFFIGS